MKKSIIIFFVFTLLITSCKNKKSDALRHQTPRHLLGYWIPRQIKWEIEDPRYKDSSRMFETASFRTLCFDTTDKFIYFASAQRHQSANNDSIIFAGEPLVTVFAGTLKFINDTIMMVDYKPIEWDINPPDKRERHEKIKILCEKDTLLLFENTLYQRTYKYDKISQQEIEKYKAHYLQ